MYKVELRQPVFELERMAADEGGAGAINFTGANGGALSAMVHRNAPDNEFLGVQAVYWQVSRAELAATVDRVRTQLVSMVAKFDTEVSKPGASTAAAAQQAISVVAHEGSTVHVTNAGSGGAAASSGSSRLSTVRTVEGSDSSTGGWWNWWRITAAVVVSALGLLFAYLAIPGIQELLSG
jgi:hypothetical protein